jgi:radical SAM protein with 4Fe4S-binding SPASM domain
VSALATLRCVLYSYLPLLLAARDQVRGLLSVFQMTQTFALGIGLTNACNLACDHCYRDTGTDALSKAQVLRALEAVPTRAVNFGTGENGLHPDFPELVSTLAERGIAVTMTTNGHSAEVLSDAVLSRFRDVEFSIDYPTEIAHDSARGTGNWALIEAQMARCKRLGVSATITSVIMKSNVEMMPALLALAGRRDAFLRVNVYQAVRGDLYSLSYDEFWRAFGLLFAHGELVVCGEPIVRAVLGQPRLPGSGCGVETIRISPRGTVLPCVYGNTETLTLADLNRLGASVIDTPQFAPPELPVACMACPQRESCRGGCGSRRALQRAVSEPDVYCPFVRGKEVHLPIHRASGVRELPKASSACTTIFRAR